MFYVNIALKTTDQTGVVAAMRALGRKGFVSPAIDGVVVVFDRDLNPRHADAIGDLVKALAKPIRTSALGVLNDDDDALMYWLSVAGEETDHYNSWPDDDRPLGGDARALAKAFSARADVRSIERVLRAGSDGAYAFAVERHEDLIEALHLPPEYMFVGYREVADESNDAELPQRTAFLAV